jgi:hypothetical protein
MGRSKNVREIVTRTLETDEPERLEDRFVVAGAVVLRQGDHFRIEQADELLPDPSELPDPE